MGRKPTGRPPGRPKGVPAFSHMQRAREALAQKAEAAVKLVEQAARVAAAKGNHLPAAWMLEHMTEKDEKGAEVRPIAGGIDKQQIESGSRAPTINIGWVIGPTAQPSLPTVKVLPPHDSD